MPIKVWDYLREYESEREETLAAVDAVFRSGQLILGEQVKAFESAFARYVGAAHGVGVNNATDALFLGLKALGVGRGDEVITVANTAVPTVAAIVAAGARPVFVDIERQTYLIDTTRLEAAVTKKTRCIVPVHLFGQCAEMDEVRRVAERRGLKILEDCAQAHGAQYRGTIAGSMSNLSAFSFYPTKILGTYGDAGMVVTGSEAIAAHVRRLRFYGMEKTYYALEDGYNSRLDEVHAAILLKKLARLGEYLARRRALAKRYDTLLASSGLTLPTTRAGNTHSYYLYVCRHRARDRILEQLKARDIHLNISYPWPIHVMPAYQRLGYAEGSLPETEAAAKEIFSLPMYPSLTDAEQDTVCGALGEILASL
jgi:aminotransferase EvaB